MLQQFWNSGSSSHMTKAVVYTAPKCPHSEKLKEFLASINVDIDEKCILESPEILEELRQLSGQMAIPVTKIDGDFFVGFDRRTERHIKRKLGV
ncbi:MAG: glutaredoxin family protein [Candidatus Thorarchaeota archaeon]|nr:glutaredoxin family protein [Candidatus Thorarchaeota archaeon]